MKKTLFLAGIFLCSFAAMPVLADETVSPATPVAVALTTPSVDEALPAATQEDTTVIVAAAPAAPEPIVVALAAPDETSSPTVVALAAPGTDVAIAKETGAAAGSGGGVSTQDVVMTGAGAAIGWAIVHHHPLAWGWKALSTVVGGLVGFFTSKAIQ